MRGESMRRILVTGSSGLVGSEAVLFYDRQGHSVHGIDNNMRAVFFGPQGDTTWNVARLQEMTSHFTHHTIDIRDRDAVFALFRSHTFDVVVHCAAQPSHDRASAFPLLDFEVNALGTINLLEATRLHAPDAVFVLLSTNKVYGDAPNEIPLVELDTRFDYLKLEDRAGVSEACRVDRSLHSLFGASKLAGDVMAQEYGRYFGLKTGVFRGGCLTGPQHSGVELHGFLSYLVKSAVRQQPYTVFGYKAKQVRDQIHSEDVISAIDMFASDPRPGEVYNLGGERENSASILECFMLVEARLGRAVQWSYSEENRRGDHVCYITDMSKFRRDYPHWQKKWSLVQIVDDILKAELTRAQEARA